MRSPRDPATAFVADYTGAVVLRGTAAPGPDGTTVVTLAGGGQIRSTDAGAGPVAATVFPWEITIGPAGPGTPRSAQNRIDAEVASITTVGGPRPARPRRPGAPHGRGHGHGRRGAAGSSAGTEVSATWKAAATRLVPLG